MKNFNSQTINTFDISRVVSPVHERKRQEVEDGGGVQSTVQHNSGGFKFEDIAG